MQIFACIEILMDHKLTLKDHTQLVVVNLYMTRRILCKLRQHAPESVLKCVYYSLVYRYFYYRVIFWENIDAKYYENVHLQQNCIVKNQNHE